MTWHYAKRVYTYAKVKHNTPTNRVITRLNMKGDFL